MPSHPLTNFEIQNYYQNEPKFYGVYSRNNLSKIKDGAYIINPDEYESTGTHWIALYENAENVTYFGIEQIQSFIVSELNKFKKKLEKSLGIKKSITNIYRVQAYDSIMSRYICIGFIDFMLKGKSLLEYRTLFSPNKYKKNDKIILKYFI